MFCGFMALIQGVPDAWRTEVSTVGGAISIIVTVAFFAVKTRADRRWQQRVLAGELCTCGYSRSGLPVGVPCPECGKV